MRRIAVSLLLFLLACRGDREAPQGLLGGVISPPPLPPFDLAAGTFQDENHRLTWTTGPSNTPYLTDLDDWRRSSHWVEDFANVGVTQAYTAAAGAGTGATQSFVAVQDGSIWRPSVVQMQAGTTTTGRWTIQGSPNNYTFSSDKQHVFWSAMVPALSIVSDEFKVYVGFGDVITGADQTDGAYYVYDRLTNGDFWSACVASNSTRTCQPLTGSAGTTATPVVAGSWLNLRATCTSARCDFYKAAPAGAWVSVASACTASSGCTANSVLLPSANTRVFGVIAEIVKTAGTTNVLFDLDVIGYYGPFSSPR